jgi:hypothetical protein
MEIQLYREVWVGPGTKCVEVSEEEAKAAKEKYAKTGECDCKYFYDELGLSDYHLRYCGICERYIGTI